MWMASGERESGERLQWEMTFIGRAAARSLSSQSFVATKSQIAVRFQSISPFFFVQRSQLLFA